MLFQLYLQIFTYRFFFLLYRYHAIWIYHTISKTTNRNLFKWRRNLLIDCLCSSLILSAISNRISQFRTKRESNTSFVRFVLLYINQFNSFGSSFFLFLNESSPWRFTLSKNRTLRGKKYMLRHVRYTFSRFSLRFGKTMINRPCPLPT